MTTAADLTAAYAVAEHLTRREARNFFYGIRLLPPPKRPALCAVYAVARRIDDIGDGDLPTDAKLTALADLRASLAREPDDAVLTAVADAARRYPIPLRAFEEIIDGVDADVRTDANPDTVPTYRTFDDLVWYCRCVAGSVGRLCLGVFGSRPHPEAAAYADALGIALQQTNILRDIREDFLAGRIYLPAEDLDRFGVRYYPGRTHRCRCLRGVVGGRGVLAWGRGPPVGLRPARRTGRGRARGPPRLVRLPHAAPGLLTVIRPCLRDEPAAPPRLFR